MKKKTAARRPAPRRRPAGPKAREKAATPRVRLAVDDRRAQLLALGTEAFSARPYDAVSTEEIATRAGISRGLLFHYFPTKRDFYVAVIDAAAEQLLATCFPERPAGQALPELVGLLQEGLDGYFTYVEAHADMFRTLLGAGGADGAQAVVDATRREFVTRIRAYLPAQPGIGEAALRASLAGWERYVEGVALDWLEHRDLTRAEVVQVAMRAAALLPGLLQEATPARR